MKRALLVTCITALVSGAPGALLLSCSDGDGARFVALDTAARVDRATFDGLGGYRVTLTRAELSLTSLHYFEGEPSFARIRDFILPRAHAHPGHYHEGEARGEMLVATRIDLLATNALPRGRGLSGAYRSARVTIGALGVALAGDATAPDGRVVPFHVAVPAARLASDRVDACPFTATDVRADGTVTLTVHPAVWLGEVDFAAVNELAVARGVVKSSAYSFSYSPR